MSAEPERTPQDLQGLERSPTRSSVRVPMDQELTRIRALPVENPRAVQLLQLRSQAELDEQESDARTAVLQAADAAIQTVHGAVQQKLDEVASLAAEFALRLAETAIGEGLARGAGLEARAREAVQSLSERLNSEPIEVRVSPADQPVVAALFEGDETVQVLVDPAAARGAVQATSRTAAVAIDPTRVLAELCERVRSELPE